MSVRARDKNTLLIPLIIKYLAVQNKTNLLLNIFVKTHLLLQLLQRKYKQRKLRKSKKKAKLGLAWFKDSLIAFYIVLKSCNLMKYHSMIPLIVHILVY